MADDLSFQPPGSTAEVEEGPDPVTLAVIAYLLSEPRSLLTLLTGDEPPELDGLLEQIGAAHPGVEIEVHEGGQPHYALLLGAE